MAAGRKTTMTAAMIAVLAILAAACTAGDADESAGRDDGAESATVAASGEGEPTSEGGTARERTSTTAAPTTTTTEAPILDASAAIPAPAETAEQLAADWVILRASEPGDRGPDVVLLQERLAAFGFAPGTADGSYGKGTERAIAAFQDLQSLPSTGVADQATLTALATYRYDGLILRAGDEGADVEALQERLASGPFDPGPPDGEYGTATKQAVWALEKLAGVPVDGDWGPLDEHAWSLLDDGEIAGPEKEHDERWVEVDLSAQVAKVYDPGQTTPTLITHISSGSGVPWSNEDYSGSSVTPLGDFRINRRISGWRESSLNIGRLYNPLYFNGGIAFHGATSVPLHPASHGCIRLPMHVAEYMPDELPNGTPVHVLP